MVSWVSYQNSKRVLAGFGYAWLREGQGDLIGI